MNTYTVALTQVTIQLVTIYADSKESAIEKVSNGEGEGKDTKTTKWIALVADSANPGMFVEVERI